jgi:hypothetical protein
MQIFVYDNGSKKAKIVLWPVFLIFGEWIFVLTLFLAEMTGANLNANI